MNQKWLILSTVMIALALDLLDVTIVNVAIPHLMAEFGVDVDTIQWVATAYLIAMGVIIPPAAYLADTYGTKRLFVVSIGLFTAGSLLCALAWNLNALVFFRVIQGFGGGMIMPLGISIVYKTFFPPERDTAMGIMGVPLLVAPALGPVLGGYLVEHAGWRLIFYINLPVGIIAFFLSLLIIKEFEVYPRKPDLIGFLLLAPALAELLLALSRGPADGWRAAHIVYLLVISGFCFVLFVLWELDHEAPLVELKLFAQPLYAGGAVVITLAIMAVMGSLFLLPVYLQDVRGYSALATGIILLPEAAAAAVALPLAGALTGRTGPLPLALGGITLLTYATFGLTGTSLDEPLPVLTSYLVVLGFGMGLGIMPVMTLALDAVPRELNNQATCILNMLRQVGSSFGIAILATVAQTHRAAHYAHLAEKTTINHPAWPELLAAGGLSAAFPPDSPLFFTLAGQLQACSAVFALSDAFLVATVFGALAVSAVIMLSFFGSAKRKDVHSSERNQTFAHF